MCATPGNVKSQVNFELWGKRRAKVWKCWNENKNKNLNMCVVGRFILDIAILAKTLVALLTLKWWLLLVWPRLTHTHSNQRALLAKAGSAWNIAAART